MVIEKICKMTVKGVKSKSESFFSISHGVLELWRKNLGGGFRPPPAWIGSKFWKFLILEILVHEKFQDFNIRRLIPRKNSARNSLKTLPILGIQFKHS